MSGGWLSVHVLDTAQGRPAVGLELSLQRITADGAETLGQWRTNEDGRCPAPLLEGAAMLPGSYQIIFDIAAWRAGQGEAGVGFYDLIPIRFQITDPATHYHVPLLLSPFGYSTYRGS